MNNRLYVVVPCYNEQEVLPETSTRLLEKVTALIQTGKIASDSKITFVNDGSSDRTWEMICELHNENPIFSGINLSRNRGQQNALLAGLMTVRSIADFVISMDADLQDDINAMDEMIEKYIGGCDIVYGVRSKRDKDTFFKRFTAENYYRFMDKMGAKIVFNHAEYRLMSRRALDALSKFREVNLFLRGLIPIIGYKSDIVTYERSERFAGESKYPLKKMLEVAFEGITSLSVKPIKLITVFGVLSLAASFGILIWAVVNALTGGEFTAVHTVLISLWAVCGLILVSIGTVGSYIGKIYMETKARPRYIIDAFLDTNHDKNI